MAIQKTWSYSTWFGKYSPQYAYTVFLLYDILKFDYTIFINLLSTYHVQGSAKKFFKSSKYTA